VEEGEGETERERQRGRGRGREGEAEAEREIHACKAITPDVCSYTSMTSSRIDATPCQNRN